MSLWTRFTSWLSGWPESAPRKEHRSDKDEDMLFREQEILAKEEIIKKSVEESLTRKAKKPKGVKPKKKKSKK